MNKVNPILIIIIALILIFAAFLLGRRAGNAQANREAIQLITALSDTLKQTINKYGEAVATISVIKTDNAKIFTQLKSSDSSINALQKVVKDYQDKLKPGGSVTNFITQNKITTGDSTTISKLDSVLNGNKVIYYPTYTSAKKDQWIDYKIIANKDSIKFNLVMQNDYSVVIGRKSGQDFVDIINRSPYSTTKSVRTYQVQMPKPKRFGVGVHVGYGLGTNFEFTPVISAGLNYNVIRF